MRFRVLLLAAWLALPAGAFAQSAPTAAPTPLSLEDALAAARDNLDVSLARRAVAAARADIVAADRAPVPVLTTKAGSMDLQNGLGGGNLLGGKRIDKAVGVDWTWERGDKRALRTRTAQGVARAADAELAEAQVQQQLLVAAAYYDLLAAQERVQQVGAIGKDAADLAAAAQRRQRAGDLSQQEALRVEIEARRAQAELRSAEADRARAAIALGQLTGRGPDLAASAPWPALDGELAAATDVEQRADVRAARERLQAAQAAYDNALALRRNDVTLGTSIDHYPGTSRRLLELRLQMPLAGVLGSYGYEGEIGRARAQLDQAQDLLDKVRLVARAEAERLAQDLRSAAARAAEFQQAIVPRARQVAGMAELAYSRGAVPLVDLLDARRTLRSVLLDDVAARAEHARALAAWRLRHAPAP